MEGPTARALSRATVRVRSTADVAVAVRILLPLPTRSH
jgi:hypothetical protein